MPSLRIILPHPSSPSTGPRRRVLAEVSFHDNLMMRNALKAIPPSPPEEVPIYLQVPIAESPTFTRESMHLSTRSSCFQPSSPWMDIKFETGVIVANDLEEQKRQNRKLTMGLLTGEVEARERRLKWAEAQEILESKRDPEPMRDWGWQCGMAPQFNELDMLRCKHWQWEAELSSIYERRVLSPRIEEPVIPIPETPRISTRRFYGGWTSHCAVHLLRLERDGPLYDRIVRVRNLDACSSREYREEMAEMADRNWYDTIMVMRPGEELPRNLRFPRIRAHVVLEWGAGMF